MNVRRWTSYLGLVVGLSACAGDGRDGLPGQDASCSARVVNGKPHIVCSDGSSAPVDPGSCTVSSGGDGTHTITCPDGQTTVIRDGEKLESGSIQGVANRFGFPPGPGITVEIVGRTEQGTTDETGRFAIEVPAGVHGVRLTYPGYLPVHVPNVLVLGNQADIGQHVLQLARPIGNASQLRSLVMAADESWIGLLVADRLGTTDQVLLDLGTGEKTLVAREVFGQMTIGSRLLLGVLEPTQPGALNVYDVERKDSWVLEGLTDFFPFASGFLYGQGDGRLRFLPADRSPIVDLGETFFDGGDEGDRWAVLSHPENGLKLFDSETKAIHTLDEARAERAFVDQVSGRMAWVDGTTDSFKTFDPQSLETKDHGPSSPGQVWWAPGGRYVVFPDPVSGHHFADLEKGSIRKLPLDTSSVWGIDFDPAGRWLIAGTGWERHILVWGHEDALTVSDSYSYAGSTESGRFVVLAGPGAVLAIDTEAGASSRELPVTGWPNVAVLPDETIVVQEDGAVFLYDLRTGTRQDSYEIEGYALFSPDNRRVAFRRPGDGRIAVAVWEEGRRLTSAISGIPVGWSQDGRYLAARVDESERLVLLSADLSEQLPVADDVAGAIPVGSGLVFGTTLPNEDLLYHWLAYP